jgi:excisionase family DNA binding protein
MTNTALSDVTLPGKKEVEAALHGQRALAAFLDTASQTQRIQIFDEKAQAHQIEVPTTALRLLLDVLSELSDGNAVRVVPIHAELTTLEAADLLNVSQPHLLKLMDEGVLPHHMTGKHRRVRLEDLTHFKSERDRAGEIAMEELARQAQELGLGYQ